MKSKEPKNINISMGGLWFAEPVKVKAKRAKKVVVSVGEAASERVVVETAGVEAATTQLTAVVEEPVDQAQAA